MHCECLSFEEALERVTRFNMANHSNLPVIYPAVDPDCPLHGQNPQDELPEVIP